MSKLPEKVRGRASGVHSATRHALQRSVCAELVPSLHAGACRIEPAVYLMLRPTGFALAAAVCLAPTRGMQACAQQVAGTTRSETLATACLVQASSL